MAQRTRRRVRTPAMTSEQGMQRNGPPSLRRRDEAHRAPGLAALVAVRDRVLGPVLRAVHHPRSTSSSDRARPDLDLRTRPIGTRPHHFRLVECSAGGRAPLIERYALPEIAGLFTDEARFARLARGRDPRHRGVGQARAWSPPPTRWRSGNGPTSPSRPSTSGSGSPSTTSPPSSTWCRSASAAPAGTWVHYGLTSSDVVDTALSVVLVQAVRPRDRRRRRARGRDHRPGPRATATTPMAGRTHGDPRRAHHVRGQARALGACRCTATASGSRGPAQAIAVGKLSGAVGTYSNIDPAVEAYVCEALGLAPGAGHAGDRPRPRTPSCSTRARRSAPPIEAFATRDPPPPAHRGARGRGAVPRRRAEGLERDAAQAQPGEGRAALRARPGAARQPAGRARERRAVARARHLALVGRAHHPPRLAACSPTTCWCKFRAHRRGHASCTPSACWRTSTRRTGSCSASRCCSRWSSRA